MRPFAYTIALLLLPLLTACGNRNDGAPFNPFPKATSSSALQNNPVQVGLQPPNQFQSCVSPLMYSSDASFNTAFQGSVLCPGLSTGANTRSNLVRLKVNTGVPVNTQLCIIPFVYDAAVQESCFSINGQSDVTLVTNQYTSIVVLPYANLQAYKDFLANPGALPPSRILFSL